MRIEQILTGNSPTFKQFHHHLVLVTAAVIVAAAGAMLLSPVATADISNDKVGTAKSIGTLLSGRLTAPYSMVRDPFGKGDMRMHYGVDIAAVTGTPILAPADSVVLVATDLYDGNPKYGKVVIIETNSKVRILLAHLDSYSVIPGQRVRNGAEIATVGNTGQSSGPHVHIETVKSGERVDPLTVLPILDLQQI